MPRWAAILLVSMAGLLLEVGYTRVVSYKLWYYYTYLVIGLALLGVGSGGVFVAISSRLRRAATERVIAVASIAGAISIGVGYLVVASTPIDTLAIWDYGSAASFGQLGRLGVICLALFGTFIAIGIVVATLLGRAGEAVGRLYFADLVGSGLGCLFAIPLITRLSPPSVICLAGVIMAVVGVLSLAPRRTPIAGFGGLVAVLLAVPVLDDGVLPEIRNEDGKRVADSPIVFADWGPVFRVDVQPVDADRYLLLHDGTFGSGLWRFDGDAAAVTRFDADPRRLPFGVLGEPPERELIIGSAGGNEIVASLRFGADDVEAVELNPVTVALLADRFAGYTGHLPDRPEVALHQGDGRSYLARGDESYDLIWYVAPDSYAANNAATAGAFVLSESYLYTSEMIEESLRHLTDDGVIVVQFGELDFDDRPNRTARYVVTARDAFRRMRIDDPGRRIAVASTTLPEGGSLSTIIVKRTPFTDAEVEGFGAALAEVPGSIPAHVPGEPPGDSFVGRLASGSESEVRTLLDEHPRDISAVRDDAPFFWHFSPFPDVLATINEPLSTTDPEDLIGERVLLLLLFFAVVYAAVFLLLPFVTVRRTWAALPAKATSAVYFGALGLGFMLFEISMIQRLVRYLGYPTYSLTVTLASILVSTGLGALWSRRFVDRSAAVMPWLLGVLSVLTVFYLFGLDRLLDATLSAGLGARIVIALLVLAPLGLCLGMFMPFGLRRVAALTDHEQEYVAWAWAVNGFLSVIGSVLTTMLAMELGFRAVQFLALIVYAVGVVAFLRLPRPSAA
jgi:hypothetical protein